jgi:hypothetical protein
VFRAFLAKRAVPRMTKSRRISTRGVAPRGRRWGEQGDVEMTGTTRGALVALSIALTAIALAQPAAAGSDDGKFGIKLLCTVVDPDTDATVRAGGVRIPGADADASTEVIPAPTLDYYFTKNLSAELFCCFSQLTPGLARIGSAPPRSASTTPGASPCMADRRRSRQWLVAQFRCEEDLARHHSHLAQQRGAWRRQRGREMLSSTRGSSRRESAIASTSMAFSVITHKPPRSNN